MTEHEILSILDNHTGGYYRQFMQLGHPYVFHIDCRLNIFRDGDNWAIAGETLGYNPRGGRIELTIWYFGNCLINLKDYEGQGTNSYRVFPVDDDDFFTAVDGEALTAEARFWTIRGQKVELNHRKEDYADAGIGLKEYEPGEIRVEEAARWLVTRHWELLRATDEELYKSIPRNLKKILVLDQWHHRDFDLMTRLNLSDEKLRAAFEINKMFGKGDTSVPYETFREAYQAQENQARDAHNQDQWQKNRPGAYETWQLIAEVITTGDPSRYKPTLIPNTHWKFWLETGRL